MSFIVNNSATNYTLYYNVLDYFKTIMENHPSIEVVAQGDIFTIDEHEFPQYVIGNVQILAANFTDSSTDYTVQLIIADKMKDRSNESEGRTNAMAVPFYGTDDVVDIHANTLAILNDLLSYTQYSVQSFDIEGEISNEPFMDRFNNGLAGWASTFTLRTHNDRPRCLFELIPLTTTTTQAPVPTSTTSTTSTSTSTTTQAPTDPIVTNGLVLVTDITSLTSSIWYDRSGNGNNGIVSGSTLALSGSLGFEFNGTDNFITFPRTLVATPSGSWTLQMNATLYNDGVSRDLFSKEYFANGWDLIWEPTNQRFVYRDFAGVSYDHRLPYTYTAPNKVLITVTGANSGVSGTTQLYINNTFVTSSTNLMLPFNNRPDADFTFGWNGDTGATYFKGAVSDLLLYNRVLTAGEVTQNYNALQ